MIQFPNTINNNRIADWVELFVITENKKISKMKIQNLFEEGGIDVESRIDDIILELDRRAKLYGAKSPITINGVTVEPTIRWRSNPIYTLCLIYSTYGVEDVSDGGTILFERIGNILFKEFFKSETHHLGFPTSTNLSTQLDKVSTLTFEPRGALSPDGREKDSGVDLISWSPFGDSRSSQIIVLLQCGAGADWKDKNSITLSTWSHYINWNYETTIPSMITSQIVQADKWIKYANQFGVLIDRARLYRIYDHCQGNIPKSFVREVLNWCRLKLS
jgi:hypothetical protein